MESPKRPADPSAPTVPYPGNPGEYLNLLFIFIIISQIM